MAFRIIVLFCLQALLLKETIALPNIISPPSNIGPNNVVLSGSVAQSVQPGFSPNWPNAAAAVPLVTEIVPNLQFGEITVDGKMPVTGLIQITGSFPVFGTVGVDGTVPSFGTAYVDSGVFGNDCPCFN